MRIIGIDPGTLALGYGMIDEADGELTHVDCGALTAPASMSMAERLYNMYTGLRDVIARFEPEEAAIEEPFVAKNARSALAVGQAIGAVTVAIVERGIPLHRYTPAQVKQAVTSYGRSDKEQVADMVCILLGLPEPPQSSDATDALAVAICHVQAKFLASLEAEN